MKHEECCYPCDPSRVANASRECLELEVVAPDRLGAVCSAEARCFGGRRLEGRHTKSEKLPCAR